MDYLRPRSWQDAVALKTENPDTVPINGGADLMVEINFARRRPSSLLDLSHLDTLKRWTRGGLVDLATDGIRAD